MRVTLRQRQQTKKGTISLYLEYYRGYTKTPEGKIKHKREYEYLDLYLVDNPSTPLERQDNKKTLELAESIRSKRHLDAEAGKFNLPSSFKSKTNLLEYFNNLAQEHIGKKGSYDNWVSAKRQLAKHCSPETTLKDVDIHFVRGFKQYLTDEALTRHGRKLSNGSQCTYFNTFRAGLNRATIDDVIPQNPARKVKNIKQVEVERVFLELDELRSAVKAECRYDVLKRAFLFSCLCGMRVGDCRALTWVKVYEVEGGWRVPFTQEKTKNLEYMYINNEAREFLGVRGEPDQKVFTGLKKSPHMGVELTRWMLKAGITKHITFHSARHTFAIMHIDQGTDLFVLQKLMGHKSINSTLVYAKMRGKKKKEAVLNMPSINI